ncbi:MAG TPA: hypothetical protein VGG02_12705 [Chthoniobacterales bacterium]|jgi:hypothetical protein
MSLHPTWPELALRLVLATLPGAWRARSVDQDMPAVLQEIANLSSVSQLQWKI